MSTWAEMVRKHFPEAEDEYVDYLLWEKTCFPFGKPEQVEKQLIDLVCMMTLWPGNPGCNLCVSPLVGDERHHCERCEARLNKSA